MQIVHFHQSNSGGAVYTTHDRGVVARWQVRNDRRFARVSGSVAAVHDILNLVVSDNSADDCSLPVIIRGNQSSGAVVQFQRRISQGIRYAILTELWPDGAYDHSLCFCALDNETINHHVVAGLHKAAGTDVAKNGTATAADDVH